jgi:acylphosphatase
LRRLATATCGFEQLYHLAGEGRNVIGLWTRMTAPIETVRLRITGQVQGVGYRFWATRTAASLGLRGWVRNRTDGSVEALVMGAPEAVAAMIEASRKGPIGAHVGDVTVTADKDDGSVGFVSRPTE